MPGPHLIQKESATSPIKRHVRNFLLQPTLQMKLGLYIVTLSIAFFGTVMALAYFRFIRLIDVVLELTDMRDEVMNLMDRQLYGVSWWLGGCVFCYVILNIALSVYFTHKMIGPTVAFRRHIRALGAGDYSSRVYLRQGDAFVEVAMDLNRLAEIMEAHSKAAIPAPKASKSS